MTIKKYGLDEAELEDLEAQGLTDEEIAEANRRRAKEQMDDENDGVVDEDIEADEAAIRKYIPGAPAIVATFINQRIGSPRQGAKLPDDISKLTAYFNKNPNSAKAISEASKSIPLEKIDFCFDMNHMGCNDAFRSGIDINVTAFITELISNAMKGAGVSSEELKRNPFLD